MAYNIPTSANLPNDVYYQLENIEKIISSDYMFNNGSYVDYTLQPVEKNLLSNRLEVSGAPIEISNSSTINMYYIDQYAKEYKGIINDIITNNLDVNNLSNYTPEEIKAFENFLLKLVNKLSALKGTMYLIELIVKLYAKFTGNELISFLEDPTRPFVYRITTTLSAGIWQNNIKKLVHPMGWYDNYNQVDSLISDQTVQNFNYKLNAINRFKLRTLSFLDGENYFLNKSTSAINSSTFGYDINSTTYNSNAGANYFPPLSGDYFGNLRYLYLTDGNINIDNVNPVTRLGRFGASFANVASNNRWTPNDFYNLNHTRFNLKPAIGLAVNDIASASDYDIKEDLTFINTKNIQFNYYSDQNTKRLDFVYPNPGFAIAYRWDLFYENSLYKSDIVSTNTYSINLKALETKLGKSLAKNVVVELTLIYHNYSKKVYKYDLSALIPMKGIRDTGESRFPNRSYIGTRMKNLLSNTFSMTGSGVNSNPAVMSYQDISLNSFLSEAKNDTFSYMTYTIGGNKVNSFTYSNALTADLVAPNNILCSINNNNYTLTFRPYLTSSMELLYPIISSYTWKLYYKNNTTAPYNLLYSKTTNQKSVVFTLTNRDPISGAIQTSFYKIELFVTLNNSNTEYQVNTSSFSWSAKTVALMFF